MTIDDFITRRQPAWFELEAAVARARSGIARMPAHDLERVGILYRRAASDLAIARRDFQEASATHYLEELCARTHPIVYRGEAVRITAIFPFFAAQLPQLFRSAWRYMVASALLLFTGAAAGWAAVMVRPDLATALVPSSLFDQMARGKIGGGLSSPGVAFGFIATNNIRVAVLACILGIAAGVPTALLLVSNGWILGTLAASIHQGGFDVRFWSLILPHGTLELSIIVFAGGTGLMMGDSILRPGLAGRGDALSAAAIKAMKLAVGFAALLPICGSIEAYISPSSLPEGIKFAVAGITGVLLYSWLLLAGRTFKGRPPVLSLGESAVSTAPRPAHT